MGEFIEITAADGHVFSAYRATAGGESGRRGGVVVIQEIFGVNDHIRAVCDRYAEQGYEVHAPALFDRVAKDTELGYSEDDVKRGRELRGGLEWTDALLDVQACVAARRGAGRPRWPSAATSLRIWVRPNAGFELDLSSIHCWRVAFRVWRSRARVTPSSGRWMVTPPPRVAGAIQASPCRPAPWAARRRRVSA